MATLSDLAKQTCTGITVLPFGTYEQEAYNFFLSTPATMPKTKLFQYAAILQGDDDTDAVLVIEPAFMLATSEKEVERKAIRAVPEQYADQIEQVEVLVRPFV